MKELQWRDIPGFNRYEVSENGDIRHKKTLVIRKPFVHPEGYEQLVLSNDHRKLTLCLVHRAVCSAFHGFPEDPLKTDVNHKDGIKANNIYTNLEWATRKENVVHSHETLLAGAANHIHLRNNQTGEERRLSSVSATARFLGTTDYLIREAIRKKCLFLNRYEITVHRKNGYNGRGKGGVFALDIPNGKLYRGISVPDLANSINIGEVKIRRCLTAKTMSKGFFFWFEDELTWLDRFLTVSEDTLADSYKWFVK